MALKILEYCYAIDIKFTDGQNLLKIFFLINDFDINVKRSRAIPWYDTIPKMTVYCIIINNKLACRI